MFGSEQMVCMRGDVLFPQSLRGPGASHGTVCLSELHSSLAMELTGPCDYCHAHRPWCDKNIWLLHLFAGLTCVARVLCANKAMRVSDFWEKPEVFISCVCVLAWARAEFMCSPVFVCFSYSYPPGSYGRWEPHVRSPSSSVALRGSLFPCHFPAGPTLTRTHWLILTKT